jgi:photosystem II stability/assembly factor-like uncharacterized protein
VRSLAAEHGTVLVGSLRGVVRSTDGGRHWHAAQGIAGIVETVAVRGRAAYAVAAKSFWRSNDRGAHWDRVGPAPTGYGTLRRGQRVLHDDIAQMGRVVALVTFPAEPRRLDLAVHGLGLFRSDDEGLHWRRIVRAWALESFAASPRHPDTQFAVRGWNGWRTSDGGATWHPFLRNVDLSYIALDPLKPWRLWALAQSGRLYASRDGGTTWR